MSGTIKQLDNNTINKIAAGEVIESPKSIVKELVENSIDAKADEVIIEIKNGGKKFIRITDNGVGIKKDEIEDAFKRHYTSKINTADDLDSLHTLGFRGEALASIAAVAKVEIISRTADDISGTKLVIEGGKTILKEDVGCPIGTTIIVTDLFYNVPARLKFLKSDVSESTNINEIVVCLSLCAKNVSFKYINNNSTVFKTPKSTNMINALSSLYDRDMVSSLIEVNYESEYVKITGYTTNLNYYRGNRKYQLLFVNDRFIKHKRANFFIEAAYNTLLPKDKHPACFLKIDIDTNLIDVNVHPAKTEIRLKDEEKFLNELKSAIYKALKQINLVKEIKSETIVKKPFQQNESKRKISLEEIFIKPDKNVESKENKFNEDLFSDLTLKKFDNSINGSIIENTRSEENEINNIEFYQEADILKEDNQNYIIEEKSEEKTLFTLFDNNFTNIENNIDNTKIVEQLGFETNSVEVIECYEETSINHVDKTTISQLNVIGMLFNTYILCESSLTNELYIIDQHAAHERINYEKYLSQIENRTITLQELLIPEVINLSYEDYYLAINNKDFFEKIGLPIESFGINDILINSIPLIFIDVNVRELFFTILDSMKEVKKNSSLDLEMSKIIKNACVKSVKAGDNLHAMEIKRLIEDLANTKSPYTCPHGRPTIIKMTKYEVERMFERIQV
ncbi:MAG TPA: DNA mismatch repair endonuclease MutL [Clostridiales bacterium]|nr:DNA mismatch repair endonuclease MutL [Clostridiales bacterium]